MHNLIVVSHKEDLKFLEQANFQVIDVDEYLEKDVAELRRARVFNLSRDYSYCKKGYYVSLIAEARGHRPLPSVSALMGLETKTFIKFVDEKFSELVQKSFRSLKGSEFELSIYFGKNLAGKYAQISRFLFHLFPAPLLRAVFIKKRNDWYLKSVKPISLKNVQDTHREFLVDSMKDYFSGGLGKLSRKKQSMKYDLAILINSNEKQPPSDEGAIKKFVQAAERLRIHCEMIEPKDISLLPRFDGLFIRETTSVNNHTYKFATQAYNEGLVVIDDPLSIIRCCNKIYLNDLLMRKKAPLPKTQIIIRSQKIKEIQLNFPLVIKKPDSSFSAGVKKIESKEELPVVLEDFFKVSDLLILQEFLKSDFDWRVGLIDGEPLYVCKYFMAKNHWQVINYTPGRQEDGRVEAFSISEVPEPLIRLAKKSCESIGNSLYGVDIKEVNGRFYIIEVNDNPNIDKGSEDMVAGESLYLRIMSSFLRRMELR